MFGDLEKLDSNLKVAMKIQTRREYDFEALDEKELLAHPIQQFANWLRLAELSDVPEANAFCLSTLGPQDQVDSRVVLLKEFNREGFVFFTNYLSKKGQDLMAHDKVSMLFFWPQLMRQIRIQGSIEMISAEESAEYFKTRPKETQIGALISRQSTPLANRYELVHAFEEMDALLEKEDAHCPSWWGGYLIKPTRFEFWQGLKHRLHDRIVYQPKGEEWEIQRLYP